MALLGPPSYPPLYPPNPTPPSSSQDYNTAMNLLSAGFASMFLNERHVYGMAPVSTGRTRRGRGS